jgi:hypothetical protein
MGSSVCGVNAVQILCWISGAHQPVGGVLHQLNRRSGTFNWTGDARKQSSGCPSAIGIKSPKGLHAALERL